VALMMTRIVRILVSVTVSFAARGVVSAQPAPPEPSPSDGAFVGMQAGVFGGAPDAYQAYSLVDGSGTHFSGFDVGYDRLLHSHTFFGAAADVLFAAQPISSVEESAQLFGSVRGRLGYASRRWRMFGSGGFGWTRDQIDNSTFARRVGWTVGGGIERAVASHWMVGADYLYSRFGAADVPVDLHVSPTMSLQRFGVGLNYRLTGSDGEDTHSTPAPFDVSGWAVHGQLTYVSQYATPFRAPYRGANSLDPNAGRETSDVTLYVGRPLWNGAALWINPEIDQGFGLSNTLGVAGFTSGEAYKVGYSYPYVRIPRAFVQQVVNFGAATDTVEAGLNQLATTRSANRLVITVGKFSVSDLFDTITYAHDPRNDFMNWALVDAGTFDYAADAWGFTYGAAVEWYQGSWTTRAALFDLSSVPNSVELDTNFKQYQFVYEVEHRHMLREQAGKMSLVGFVTRGRMGRFADAVALAEATGEPADIAAVRRYNTRPGVNLNVEQQLSTCTAVFGRFGWANGDLEPYEFADIDRTASAGASLAGTRWGRPTDTIAIATVINDISTIHRAYLNAGGLGILVGDGQLPHPGTERIVEMYYRVPLGSWQFTADYQFVVNPAYNRDRGPVSVFAGRLHTQF
jgi:high affinity Mn2+ porin